MTPDNSLSQLVQRCMTSHGRGGNKPGTESLKLSKKLKISIGVTKERECDAVVVRTLATCRASVVVAKCAHFLHAMHMDLNLQR